MSVGRSTIHRQIAEAAHIGDGIAGMIDGGDDKAGVGQRLGRIVKVDEVAAVAVRDDDQRQPVAADRTILYPGQGDLAEVDLARRLGAGIPHRPRECRTVGVGGHLDEAETGSLGERRRQTEGQGDRDEEFDRIHDLDSRPASPQAQRRYSRARA
jgi:hypothetical protein